MDELARTAVIKEMALTEGWKEVQKFLENEIKNNATRLLTIKPTCIDKIIEYQERVKSYKAILRFVESYTIKK